MAEEIINVIFQPSAIHRMICYWTYGEISPIMPRTMAERAHILRTVPAFIVPWEQSWDDVVRLIKEDHANNVKHEPGSFGDLVQWAGKPQGPLTNVPKSLNPYFPARHPILGNSGIRGVKRG